MKSERVLAEVDPHVFTRLGSPIQLHATHIEFGDGYKVEPIENNRLKSTQKSPRPNAPIFSIIGEEFLFVTDTHTYHVVNREGEFKFFVEQE